MPIFETIIGAVAASGILAKAADWLLSDEEDEVDENTDPIEVETRNEWELQLGDAFIQLPEDSEGEFKFGVVTEIPRKDTVEIEFRDGFKVRKRIDNLPQNDLIPLRKFSLYHYEKFQKFANQTNDWSQHIENQMAESKKEIEPLEQWIKQNQLEDIRAHISAQEKTNVTIYSKLTDTSNLLSALTTREEQLEMRMKAADTEIAAINEHRKQLLAKDHELDARLSEISLRLLEEQKKTKWLMVGLIMISLVSVVGAYLGIMNALN